MAAALVAGFNGVKGIDDADDAFLAFSSSPRHQETSSCSFASMARVLVSSSLSLQQCELQKKHRPFLGGGRHRSSAS